ncbi:hypothetical protein CBL_08124 [Carabus blaptoides fortunei]
MCDPGIVFLGPFLNYARRALWLKELGWLLLVQKREPAVAATCKMCNGCVVILIIVVTDDKTVRHWWCAFNALIRNDKNGTQRADDVKLDQATLIDEPVSGATASVPCRLSFHAKLLLLSSPPNKRRHAGSWKFRDGLDRGAGSIPQQAYSGYMILLIGLAKLQTIETAKVSYPFLW